MVIVILSWLYIAAVCLVIGMAINRFFSQFIPVPGSNNLGLTGYISTGLVAVTVYAEVFSIFYKVGAICHLIMLIAAAVGGYFYRADIKKLVKFIKLNLQGRRLVLFSGIILMGAFFTSRGSFHTDTGIYHAQAIRLIEEYGVLKGLGNLQLHFAYNSAYLPLCALFTLSFILPFALHTMSGFLMVLCASYASHGLLEINKHKRHGGDMARIAILIYSLSNLTGLQSPATDYGTQFLVLYIFCNWICYAEEHYPGSFDKDEDIAFYGYLSILSIFAVSMKLSAAFIVILAVLPFVALVRRKMWKQLFIFLASGFLIFLPYLVRNVIISGWLIYPVTSIDIFNVDWKIPVEYVKNDSNQIMVWGRCLYDVKKVDWGMKQWLPVWWEAKQHYEEMLIYAQFLAVILSVLSALCRVKQKKIDPALPTFYLALFVNILMWFFTAPFIRYGLALLLLFPLCALGDAIDLILKRRNLILGFLSGLIMICLCSWVDRYFTESMVFVKHNITASNYLMPVDFPEGNMTAVDMDGETVYVADYDEVNSYHVFPASCYMGMVENTQLRGSSIKDGFKAK